MQRRRPEGGVMAYRHT